MSEFIFEGKNRTDLGKGASRRLRREGLIPAVIYGAGVEAKSLTLNHNEVLKCFRREEIYSSIVTVSIEGTKESAVLRDVQRHPFKPLITHLDFMRVRADELITVSIPLHLLNAEDSKGVKLGMGIVTHHLVNIEVSCLPKNLPSVVELDIIELDIGEILTVADIKPIKNVIFVNELDEAVVTIIRPRVEEEVETTTDEEATDAEEASEDDKAAEEGDSE